jgi:hypothetical protein
MRAPPEAKSLAPGGNRGEAKGTFIQEEEKYSGDAGLDQASLAEPFGSGGTAVAADLANSGHNGGTTAAHGLTRHTSDLAVIADWRDELHAKIRRAQMRLELVDLDLDEQTDIADEVQAFKQLCRALMATMAAPARTACAATRRAA